MTTYTIYLGATPIATTDGTEYTYAVWRKTVELAELIGSSASLVWDESGEEVETFGDEDEWDEDEEYINEDWDDYEPDVDETGFDPYEGCYTWDC
jgi:hypothetical protein